MCSLVLLLSLFSFCYANCCPHGVKTLSESFAHSEFVFEALVREEQVQGVHLQRVTTADTLQTTRFLKLAIIEVFKGTPRENAMRNKIINARIDCLTPHLPKGSQAVFFGTLLTHLPASVKLSSCDPNGGITECERKSLRTRDFAHCPTAHHSHLDSCTCAGGPLGTTWSTGIFDCYSCHCYSSPSPNNPSLVGCVSSCKIKPVCVIVPTAVGSFVVVLITVIVAVLIRLRISRNVSPPGETELYEVENPSVQENSYQPLIPNGEMNSVLVTQSNGQQVLINTHPMVVMSQDGELLVVQVASPSSASLVY